MAICAAHCLPSKGNHFAATAEPHGLTFADTEGVRDLARRGLALGISEARTLFDYSIGRGGGGL